MDNVVVVALRTAAVTIVLTGIAYPLAVYGVAQAFFPTRANGSLLRGDDGTAWHQHLREQVLGRRLAAGAGHADNRAAVRPREHAG